jgi:hypothetical protein
VTGQQYPAQEPTPIPYEVQQQRMREAPPLEVVRVTHPGDEAWCRSQAAVDWIIASMDRMADFRKMSFLDGPFAGHRGWENFSEVIDGERVLKVYDVAEGYLPCFSTVAGLCDQHLKFPVCHATAEFRTGQKISGTFSGGRVLGLVLGLKTDSGRYFDVINFETDDNRRVIGWPVP